MASSHAFARVDRRHLLRKLVSHAMFGLSVGCAVFVVALLAVLIAYLVKQGGAAITPAFFTEVPSGDPLHPGGMAHALVGTLVLSLLAGVVGVPVGVFAGVYLAEYRDERLFAHAVRFVADLLAGVPSIVVGVLGYELIVVPIGHYSGFAGALAVPDIMVPIEGRTTEEMLLLVPLSVREGALALGASRAATIMRVVLPSATGGVLTGVMLALARIAGETAPLLFTALGSRFLTLDPTQPFPSLTVQIFTYATGPYDAQKAVAWAGILVLVALLTLMNVAVRAATRRFR
jgi:phosphate transport system permease protein